MREAPPPGEDHKHKQSHFHCSARRNSDENDDNYEVVVDDDANDDADAGVPC